MTDTANELPLSAAECRRLLDEAAAALASAREHRIRAQARNEGRAEALRIYLALLEHDRRHRWWRW